MGPKVVLVTGPPGTGKSTLAEQAADLLSAPVLGWDWVMAGMTSFAAVQDAFRRLPREEYRRVGWSILWNLAAAQLRRSASVVLDGVARDIEVDGTREMARQACAACVVVVTSCSDVDVHRSRVEGRARAIPGWHELEWDHVAGLLAQWQPPSGADLSLDAIAPLEANVQALTALLTDA